MSQFVERSSGDRFWYENGLIHRDIEPAIEKVNGTKCWYHHGRIHRGDDLPAIIWSDGDKEWWLNGKRHREGGLPAIEWQDGTKAWYYKGVPHRDNGLPAYVFIDSSEWWVNGKRHREGELPAVEKADGTKLWFKNGEQYFPERFWLEEPKKISADDNLSCVISLEPIHNDSEICRCHVCSKVALFKAMTEWLKLKEICPHCRCIWTNFTKYT